MTLRPRNICLDCRYGWFPRGNAISRRCPNCKSSRTKIETAQDRWVKTKECPKCKTFVGWDNVRCNWCGFTVGASEM